jgi:hypothetical protein
MAGMAGKKPKKQAPNVFCIAQNGRLGYESVIFAASFRAANPDFAGRLIIGEPQPGSAWQGDPRISPPIRELLESCGAEIVPFENRYFGKVYPYGNKIEGLMALPKGEPFVFFDTDTIFTGPLSSVDFDFDRPSASMRREGTWPQIELYGPGYGAIWKSLYDKFGLEFETSLDRNQPEEYWQRYLYFNAGWFFHRCPHEFGQRFLDYALAIRDDPPDELVCQSLDPWLDQVALPLVIHSLGGGRPGPDLAGLDGNVTGVCCRCCTRVRRTGLLRNSKSRLPPTRSKRFSRNMSRSSGWSIRAVAARRAPCLTATTCPAANRPSATG